MRKPNLFIVGAPKCGTTALHQYLASHPQICMSDPKEPNYFGSLVVPFPKSDGQYLTYCFSHWRDESVAGEASPNYLACPYAPARLRRYNPAAKIVIMLRNPVEMMYSLHSEFVFAGSEQETDFANALALGDGRLAGKLLKTSANPPGRLAYRMMSSFPAQVRRYLDAFPWEQVHVLLLDDMQRDTPGTYRRVLEFLKVDPDFEPGFERVNANKRVKSAALRKFLISPPTWLRAVGRKLIPSVRVQHGMRHGMRVLNRKINAQAAARAPMPESLRTALLAEKAGEIRELAELINRDLSAWHSV